MSASTSGPPDPAVASTAGEFIGLLNELRMWAGQPSLRRLRRLADTTTAVNGDVVDALPISSVSYVLRGRGLPRLPRADFLTAYVTARLDAAGFAGDVKDQVERWRGQWWRLCQLRSQLSGELGADLGAGQAIEQGQPPSATPGEPGPGRNSPVVVPRQLPAAIGHFVGRKAELKRLTT